MTNKSAASFYVSIFLFILYLFCTQWSVSASYMNDMHLHDILAAFANCAWVLSLVMIMYKIVTSFAYYAQNRWFMFFSIASIVLIAFVSKSPAVVLPLLIGFAGIYASNKTLAKTIVLSVSGLLVLSYIFSLIGLNGGDVVSKPLFGQDESKSVVAMAIGLTNPNVAMLLFTNIVVLVLYLCKRRELYTLASILFLSLAIILGNMTGSTTGLIISITSIILMFCYKYIVGFHKFIAKIVPYAFMLVTLLTFLVALGFGMNRPNVVNDTLTNRPYLWELRIENNSYINLYGDKDEYRLNRDLQSNSTQATNYPLDNEPLYVMVHYGLAAYVLFLYVFYTGSKKLKDSELLVYVFVACLAIFVEKIVFIGFVYIFLAKAITDYYLIRYKTEDEK